MPNPRSGRSAGGTVVSAPLEGPISTGEASKALGGTEIPTDTVIQHALGHAMAGLLSVYGAGHEAVDEIGLTATRS